VTRRLANSINYKSASFNGFDVLATYSAGEKTTGPSGDLKGIGAEYKLGDLYLGAGYHIYKRVSTGDDKEYGAGAAYKFADVGGLEVSANYLSADPDGANNKFKQYNLGAAYPFGASKVYVNLQQNKIDTGAKGNAWSLGYTYSLSKRTNLYASYASMNNNGLATFGLNSGSNSLAPAATSLGADPSAFTVGVRHKF
jgi:predicted porin